MTTSHTCANVDRVATMRVLPVVCSLLAVGRKPTKWFIDGNNLMGHKGTPRQRDQVIEKLKPMADGGLDTVLVFDSHLPGDADETTVVQDGSFFTVITGEEVTADDYILGEIDSIKESGEAFVQVVTADRDLRRKALLGTRTVVRGVINPVVFWRRYRPRLTGLKKPDKTNEV